MNNKTNIKKQQVAEYAINNRECLYRLAYSYVKNTEDALDIVQDSIYKAISSVDSLNELSYVKTWFYRIIVNTSLDLLRKQKKIVPVDDEVLSTLDLGAVDNYQNLDLKKSLDSLPSNYRSVIILRYFEDLKIQEVAEVVGENVNTVKTRLYKALETLKIRMEE